MKCHIGYSALLTISFSIMVHAATIQKSAALQSYFGNPEGPRPAIYKIEARPFSQPDALKKIGVLKNHGFDWNETTNTNGSVVYKNESKGQWFSYEETAGRYQYYNPLILGFSDTDSANMPKLRAAADSYLADLLGNGATSYSYANSEYEYQVLRGQPKKLCYITYRYVRNVDGRLILGITSHIRITIGKGRIIKAVDFTNPILTKDREIRAMIKKKAMQKCLDLYSGSADFRNAPDGRPIANVLIAEANDCYFAEEMGNSTYLLPQVSFYSLFALEAGETLKREFHLMQDAERVPNVSQDDILYFEVPTK